MSSRLFLRCWWPGLAPPCWKVKSAAQWTRSSTTFSFWTAAAECFAENKHRSSLRSDLVVVVTKPGQGTLDCNPPWWLVRWWNGHRYCLFNSDCFKCSKHGGLPVMPETRYRFPVVCSERRLRFNSCDVEEWGRKHDFKKINFSVTYSTWLLICWTSGYLALETLRDSIQSDVTDMGMA